MQVVVKEGVWCDNAHYEDAVQILVLCPNLPFCRLDIVSLSICIYFKHKEVVLSAIQIYSFKTYGIANFV